MANSLLIEQDDLAPYAFLAAHSAGIDLQTFHSVCEARWPGNETRLRHAVLRHLKLFCRAIRKDHGDLDWECFVRSVKHLVARAQQNPDPLAHFLARKRLDLSQLVIEENNPADRAALTWDEIRADLNLSRAFDQHMICRATKADIFFPTLFSKSTGTIVDIGGGPGHYLAQALTKAGAHWKGVLLDSYQDAGWAINDSEFESRFDVHIADASTQEIPAAELYILGSLLHDLTDDVAKTVLRSCFQASEKGSRLIIVERCFDVHNLRDSGRDLDIQLLYGGRERTSVEYANLITAAGFSIVNTTITPDHYLVLVVAKEAS